MMMSFKKNSLLIWLLAMLLITACVNKSVSRQSPEKEGGDIKYAELLSIEPCDGYTKVEVRTTVGGSPSATYYLVPRGSNVNIDKSDGDIIEIPVSSLVVNSSVYAAPIKEMDGVDVIKGVTDASYFAMPEIQEGLRNGSITDIGNSQSPSVEKIVTLNPDGILINLYEGMNVGNLPTVGVPFVKFADNMEPTPLGRAEWINFLGLLIGKEQQADSIFKSVEEKYNTLKAKVAKVHTAPVILSENMYEGIWYVPAGESMAAVLFKDAGGSYPWADTKGNGSLSLSYEEVLHKASEADVWFIKMYGQKLTRSSLKGMDERYGRFKAFKQGNIWYSDTKESGLFDISAFHPELVLADYVAILHPELSDKAKPRFYRLIGKE